MLSITDIKIRKVATDGKLKAIVSVTLGGEFAVHDIKVIQGETRLFIAMPSRKDENGLFRDIVHPIHPETRNKMEELILDEYIRYVESAGVDFDE